MTPTPSSLRSETEELFRSLARTKSSTGGAVFYLQKGKVKLTVISQQGKEAIIALLEPGSFFGEACLAGEQVRVATVRTTEPAVIVRIDKHAMLRVLRKEPTFAELFIAFMVSRNIRIQEDLIDQLFNSSEKRLARVLLLLAHFGKEGQREPLIAKISQETLAEMVGTTRSRVSFFLNKFRRLGFIDYDGEMRIQEKTYGRVFICCPSPSVRLAMIVRTLPNPCHLLSVNPELTGSIEHES